MVSVVPRSKTAFKQKIYVLFFLHTRSICGILNFREDLQKNVRRYSSDETVRENHVQDRIRSITLKHSTVVVTMPLLVLWPTMLSVLLHTSNIIDRLKVVEFIIEVYLALYNNVQEFS
ncbi:hypothetical protein Trydic_g5428 [Trypoxylus dichotomus]